MTFSVTQLNGFFPRQPDPLLSPFCHCSPNRLNCQSTPCFASTGFRNCNIHLTVCQERLQKLKVIDVEGAAIGIGGVYLGKENAQFTQTFLFTDSKRKLMMISTETSRS